MYQRESEVQRKRRVAIYARVSTEHEAQISALKNQLQWYDETIERHPEWELVERYVDEGITGTNAKKRKRFNQMIEDAKAGKFDLIVTREVCRFARNTVDALQYTRLLLDYGVEVFFAEDGIYSASSDGELKLAIFAALAQDESRRDSIRTRAGQMISRSNGVLYGNGNILGYDLKRCVDENGKWNSKDNTYVINEEQAETVRMIYDMYTDGFSTTRIARELSILRRKGSNNKEVKWSAARVNDILHNKTYCGYIGYNKSNTVNLLEHKRKTNYDRSTYVYVKGSFEPIISEEQWNLVQKMMYEKSMTIPANTQKHKRIGYKKSYDMWSNKLRCSCGSSFRKNKWRVNKKSNKTMYGYQCYNQLNNGSYAFRVKNNLSADGFCAVKMVSDWKLDLIAKTIIQELWCDRKEAVKLALKLVRENYIPEDNELSVNTTEIRRKIAGLEAKSERLLELRLDDAISKEEFVKKRSELESEITNLRTYLVEDDKSNTVENKVESLLNSLERTLSEYIDFSKNKIADDIVEKLIKQVVVYENDRYKVIVDFLMDSTRDENGLEFFLYNKRISYEEAEAYRKKTGSYLRRNQWNDMNIEVYTIIR